MAAPLCLCMRLMLQHCALMAPWSPLPQRLWCLLEDCPCIHVLCPWLHTETSTATTAAADRRVAAARAKARRQLRALAVASECPAQVPGRVTASPVAGPGALTASGAAHLRAAGSPQGAGRSPASEPSMTRAASVRRQQQPRSRGWQPRPTMAALLQQPPGTTGAERTQHLNPV